METIKEINSVDQFIEDGQKYGTYVNLNRAFADIRDGLKPVQRNILFAMLSEDGGYNGYVKCAAIVGETMKHYHPHGDSSIYEALVLMSNWYTKKIPLIDPYGNFGNIQGAGAGAMRYTEARMSEFAKECVVGELKKYKGLTLYRRNYNNKRDQPYYLPCAVPLLLIEGSEGIGYGKNAKSYIPAHNIIEVIDATINRIKDPTKPVVLIPDECKGADIIDTDWESICNTGHGTYKSRAVIDIEDTKKGPILIIKNTPDGVKYNNPNADQSLNDKIVELSKTSLPQIIDIDDDSKHHTGLRIIIRLRKGSDPYYVREMLYKKTSLETSNTVNFMVVHDITSMRMSYTEYIDFFIEFNKNRKYKLYMSKYSTLETKIHELDFYIKILESGKVDEVIDKIRKRSSIDDEEFIEWMIKEFNITDLQAEYVYNIKLKKLSLGYLNKYKEDIASYMEEANKYVQLITDDDALNQDVINELEYFKNKYGKPRVSRVITVGENEIPSGLFTVVITENNFVKKLQVGQAIGKADNPKYAVNIDNTDSLLLFSNKGKVYKIPIHRIPLMDRNNSGIDIRIMIKGLTSDIISILPESLIKDSRLKGQLVVLTKENHIKRIDCNDLYNVPPSGIIYAKLSIGESVQSVRYVDITEDVIVYSDRKALRYPVESIPLYGRMANGVLAMGGKIEEMDGVGVIHRMSTFIIVITESGKINKFHQETLESSDRTKAGASVIKLSSTDRIHSIHGVRDEDVLVLVSASGTQKIPVLDIPCMSSISSGTKFVSGKDFVIKTRIEREVQ